MTDWSSVGRKSRRKGKAFEQEVARYLTAVSGEKFTSTRNSGRTDLKGDIYCMSTPSRWVVECKDRKLSIKALMSGSTWVHEAIMKASREAKSVGADSPVMFVKADGVVFIHCRSISYVNMLHRHRFIPDCEVRDVNGRIWWRVVLGRPQGTTG